MNKMVLTAKDLPENDVPYVNISSTRTVVFTGNQSFLSPGVIESQARYVDNGEHIYVGTEEFKADYILEADLDSRDPDVMQGIVDKLRVVGDDVEDFLKLRKKIERAKSKYGGSSEF